MKFCWMVLCVLCAGSLRADPFAEALLNELYSSERNVVFSPCSITAALAMSGAGARGETAAQMVWCFCVSAKTSISSAPCGSRSFVNCECLKCRM